MIYAAIRQRNMNRLTKEQMNGYRQRSSNHRTDFSLYNNGIVK